MAAPKPRVHPVTTITRPLAFIVPSWAFVRRFQTGRGDGAIYFHRAAGDERPCGVAAPFRGRVIISADGYSAFQFADEIRLERLVAEHVRIGFCETDCRETTRNEKWNTAGSSQAGHSRG